MSEILMNKILKEQSYKRRRLRMKFNPNKLTARRSKYKKIKENGMSYNDHGNRLYSSNSEFDTPGERAMAIIKSRLSELELYLGCSLESMEIMEWGNDAGAINNVIAEVEGKNLVKKLRPFDKALALEVSINDGLPLGPDMSYIDNHNSSGFTLNYNRSMLGELKSISIHDIKVALLNLTVAPGPAADWVETFTYLVFHKTNVNSFVKFLADLRAANKKAPTFHTIAGRGSTDQTTLEPYSWDQVVLDPVVLKLLKEDFESFFNREEWFKRKKLPFRRGYLLHGDPGNGKTSAIKAMMWAKGMDAFTLSLFDKSVGLSDLNSVFEAASNNKPSLVVLEDIDRAFPKKDSKCAISIQELLNAIDGIGTKEGIITVATANDPAALDSAILKRPGRFDRVIKFDNPSLDLRRAYFLNKDPNMHQNEAFKQAIEKSDGYSFAQLQEAYIMAGQLAYDIKSDEITGYQLLEAVNGLLKANKDVKKANAAGFVP